MNNLVEPQSQETKDFLEKECGLRPYQPTREPNYANPDKMECKWTRDLTNLAFFADHMYFNVLNRPFSKKGLRKVDLIFLVKLIDKTAAASSRDDSVGTKEKIQSTATTGNWSWEGRSVGVHNHHDNGKKWSPSFHRKIMIVAPNWGSNSKRRIWNWEKNYKMPRISPSCWNSEF